MAIAKVKLPNNVTEDVKDARLPDVTASDNGSVLKVASGIWSKGDLSTTYAPYNADGYLPLTGGTLTGNLTIKETGGGTLYLQGTERNGDGGTIMFRSMADASNPQRNGFKIVSEGVAASGDKQNLVFYVSRNETSPFTPSWEEALKINRDRRIYATSYISVGGYSDSYIGSNAANEIWLHNSNGYPLVCSGTVVRRGSAMTDATLGDTTYRWANVYSSAVDVSGNSTFSGNVGIGTSSPSTNLHVAGTSMFENANLRDFSVKRTSSTGSAGITYYAGNQTTNYWFCGADPGATWPFAWYYGSTNKATLSTGGNLTVTGTVNPGSDTRIKDDQKEISKDNAFDVLERLTPKTWTWNEKMGENVGKSGAGLVAQEVKGVLPDAVSVSAMNGIEDFHSLNYNTIQGYEIAAIKALIEEVKELKAEIAKLKAQ